MVTTERSSQRPMRGLNPHGSSQRARSSPSMGDRHRAIAVAAYFRAERRGFVAGGELADWLDAEREVDRQLSNTEMRPD
jgi:Protein of unknown function (DUF2934)